MAQRDQEGKARALLEDEALTKAALRAQEKLVLSTARDLEAKAKEALSVEKDELLKGIGQLNSRIELARVELERRDETNAKLITEVKQKFESEIKSKTELQAKLQIQAKISADIAARNQILETESQELQRRQKAMNEELRKAAVQIELIKDLLMRDLLA